MQKKARGELQICAEQDHEYVEQIYMMWLEVMSSGRWDCVRMRLGSLILGSRHERQCRVEQTRRGARRVGWR